MPVVPKRKSQEEPFSLCFFTDQARPGLVKKFLTPPLSPAEAAQLHVAFVDDLLSATRQLAGVRRVLYVYGDPGDPSLGVLARREGIEIVAQEGADPGARKAAALSRELGLGKRAAAIIGTDAPTLPVSFIADALERLDGGCENVVGPTGGGGYYLLGVSRLVRADLLKNIGWGGKRVLADLMTRLATLATPSAVLPFWYDVQSAEDLSFLRAHLAVLIRDDADVAPATRTVLSQLGRAAWT